MHHHLLAEHLYLYLKFKVIFKQLINKQINIVLMGNFEDNYNNNTILLYKDSWELCKDK